MRKLTTSFLIVSLLSLLNLAALANDKYLKEHITFSDDVMVGNTLVKKGDYLVRYNAETSEVSFVSRNKNKVVATAKATVKMNDKKAESDALYTMKTATGEKLTGLRLGGQREELIISDTGKIMTGEMDDELVPDVDMIDYELMCLPWF